MLDYAIVDFENRKNLYVAHETRDEGAAREVASYIKGGNCEVYCETESNGKLFRVICVKRKAMSDVPL